MKTRYRVLLGTFTVLLVFIIAGFAVMYGKTASVGRCFVDEGGAVLWIDEGGNPVEMHDRSWSRAPFNGLTTGDQIWLLHADAIAESYPGQVSVYACFKLADGGIEDLPTGTLDILSEMGWTPVE